MELPVLRKAGIANPATKRQELNLRKTIDTIPVNEDSKTSIVYHLNYQLTATEFLYQQIIQIRQAIL